MRLVCVSARVCVLLLLFKSSLRQQLNQRWTLSIKNRPRLYCSGRPMRPRWLWRCRLNCVSNCDAVNRSCAETLCHMPNSGTAWCPCAWGDAFWDWSADWSSGCTPGTCAATLRDGGFCGRPACAIGRILCRIRCIWTVSLLSGCICVGRRRPNESQKKNEKRTKNKAVKIDINLEIEAKESDGGEMARPKRRRIEVNLVDLEGELRRFWAKCHTIGGRVKFCRRQSRFNHINRIADKFDTCKYGKSPHKSQQLARLQALKWEEKCD